MKKGYKNTEITTVSN